MILNDKLAIALFVKELNERDVHEMDRENFTFPWLDGQPLPCKNVDVDERKRVQKPLQKLSRAY